MQKLDSIRTKIDIIDNGIVRKIVKGRSFSGLLKSRYAYARKIAAIKKQKGMLIRDKSREAKILKRLGKIAGKKKKEVVDLYLRKIFPKMISVQKSIK